MAGQINWERWSEDLSPDPRMKGRSNRIKFGVWLIALGGWIISFWGLLKQQPYLLPGLPDPKWVWVLVIFTIITVAEMVLVAAFVMFLKLAIGATLGNMTKEQLKDIAGDILVLAVLTALVGLIPTRFDLRCITETIWAWIEPSEGIAIEFCHWLKWAVCLGSEVSLTIGDEIIVLTLALVGASGGAEYIRREEEEPDLEEEHHEEI